VALLRQARVADPGNYEVAWRLAMHNYYLGAHTTDDDERDDAFREGIEFGKIAVQLQDGRPEGHFWLGANYGGDAENSTLASLSNVEDIKREMGTVIKLDERFEAGSAYLALGQLYLQAPRVLGGNVQTAIEYLERGIKIGPNNALLRLNLAKAYRAANRDGEARKQIDFIMQMTPDPQYVPEQKEAIREGQQLLKEMDER
jgi:tetratricopeptide (TPR) repeat protein